MGNTVEQSKNMDELLLKMNESLKGRLESEIPLGDPFWQHRQVYQNAFHAAGGVHIPEEGQLEIDRKKEEDKIIKDEKDKADAEIAEKLAAKRAEFDAAAKERADKKAEEEAKAKEAKEAEEARSKAEQASSPRTEPVFESDTARELRLTKGSSVEIRPNDEIQPRTTDEQLKDLGL